MLPAQPFYLLRHGESEANAAEIAAGGGLDSPLNETGLAQAEALAAHIDLLDVKPDVIYHSTMQRAKVTAQIVNKSLSLPSIEDIELREHELGEWEGQPWSKVMPLIEEKVAPPKGESHQQFAQRIQSIFTDILESDHSLPMIVCHGGVFHALGALYEYGMTRIQNCHLHYFEPETHPEYTDFPWRVWHFDVEDNQLVKKRAAFCLSHQLSKIA